MALEIERKFLVKGEFRSDAESSSHIAQGYICNEPERTVRVRIRDDKAYITIKGPSSEDGLCRFEWEKEIAVDEAKELLKLAVDLPIDKTRFIVPFAGHAFEVDVFHGANEGLVLAELELAQSDEPFARPVWLGAEVTGDKRYYNAYLAQHPFTEW